MRPTRIRLVDWEMAGWGDPAFDVGSALSDFAAFGLDAAPGAVRRRGGGVLGAPTCARAASTTPPRRALLERSVRFAGARLVQSAYEHTQETTVMSARVVRLVGLARELLLPAAAPPPRDVLGLGA